MSGLFFYSTCLSAFLRRPNFASLLSRSPSSKILMQILQLSCFCHGAGFFGAAKAKLVSFPCPHSSVTNSMSEGGFYPTVKGY